MHVRVSAVMSDKNAQPKTTIKAFKENYDVGCKESVTSLLHDKERAHDSEDAR